MGDATDYGQLLAICQSGLALPPHPEDLILPPARASGGRPAGLGVDCAARPRPSSARATTSTKGAICEAIAAQKLTAVGGVKSCTKAGTGCGSCVTLLNDLLKAELKRAGVAVINHLCEHFPYTRQELFHLVKVHEHRRSFDELLAGHGKGQGCEICKPAVASILASTWNEHILEREHVGLQDTNDRFLANIQRDGTYSVVPRVAGRRDHARPADRARPGGQALRPLHQDHRRPARRPVRRAARAAARRSGASSSPPASSRATPTARRCAR